MESRACLTCKANFSRSDWELSLYKRLDFLPPQLCSACRRQRRQAFRNERTLYRRTCNSCSTQIISIFSPDGLFRVFCPPCWWSDEKNNNPPGRDFDFSRSFFEQYQELLVEVPLLSLFSKNNDNSDYVNNETDSKNCYLCFGGHYNEDCYYSTYSLSGKSNVDCYWALKSELCYECIEVENCFHSTYLRDCLNCSDCHYCDDCTGCRDCLGCVSLRHKQYCVFNEQKSRPEYERLIQEALATRERTRELMAQHIAQYQKRSVKQIHCENCRGDRLVHCKNTDQGFLTERAEDCKYIDIAVDLKDCLDLTSVGWAECAVDCGSSMHLHSTLACSSVAHLSFSSYCFQCFHSTNLFGCVGLNRRNYCILNKQFPKAAYHEMCSRIISEMKRTGEYGQFFPPNISPFAYNETVAQLYCPLTAEQATTKGWFWRERKPEVDQKAPRDGTLLVHGANLSARIEDISNDILHTSIICAKSSRLFKIQAPELNYYRKMSLPLPRLHPDIRHAQRLAQQSSMNLRTIQCALCNKSTETTISPNTTQFIYCEACYLKQLDSMGEKTSY